LGTAGLTADLQRIVLPAVTESHGEPLFRELMAIGLGRLRSFRLVTGRPPYAGLLPLQEEDAGVFFGRREETRSLVDLIEKLAKYREKRMVLLIGPSGSGKSSLLRAGIIPQFRQRPGWKVVVPDPLNHETAMREMDAVPSNLVVLMGLDQIDEAVTESDGAIFALLRYAVERPQKRCLVIGTLRSESLATFNERLGAISDLIERFVVGPLTRSDYRGIIELPAQAAGGSLDPNLVDALLADVASSRVVPDYSQAESRSGSISSDALPLLAVTLRQLWDLRTSASELTLTTYERIGRFDGAIARTAEAVMAASRLDADDLAQLRRAFLGMVRIDRDGHFSRRPLRLNEVRGRQPRGASALR